MGADFSRIRSNPLLDFAGVELKQGGVVLDADVNELVAVLDRRLRALASDVLGRSTVSQTTPDAFKITAGGGDLQIGKGRLYVDGLLAENHGAASTDLAKQIFDPLIAEPAYLDKILYSKQPYLKTAPALPTAGRHLVYLDVWDREVTHLERPELVETAVGVETSSRVQTVWQVRVLADDAGTADCGSPDANLAGWVNLTAPSTGRLTTGTFDVPPSADPCELPPTGGYRGLENQTYRVEIQDPGQPGGPATFKWSRENASVGSRVASIISATELELQTLGRDDVLRVSTGDWVEIIDDAREMAQKCGEMRRITVNEAARRITFSPALPADMLPAAFPSSDVPRDHNLRIRRWDHKGKVLRTAADGTTPLFQDLDAGGSTGVIHVPAAGTTLLLENGVTVSFGSTGTKGFRAGDYWVFAARTGDASIEVLDHAAPRGIHHHYARLGIWDVAAGSVTDCRTPWPPRGEGDDCGCTECVTPESHASGALTIQAAVDRVRLTGGTVCLTVGQYQLDEPVRLIGTRAVRIKGQGAATVVITPGGAFQAATVIALSIEDLAILSLGNASAISIRTALGVSLQRLIIAVVGSQDLRGAAIALSGAVIGATIRDNAILAPLGIQAPDPAAATSGGTNLPPAPMLMSAALRIENNALWCDRAAVALVGRVIHLLGTRVTGNEILACRLSGIAALGINGPGASMRIADNTMNVSGPGIIAGVDGLLIEGNKLVAAAQGDRVLQGAGIALRNGLDPNGSDQCQVLANQISGFADAAIAIQSPTRELIVKLNIIERCGNGIVSSDEAKALHVSIENNHLTDIGRTRENSVGDIIGIGVLRAESATVAGNVLRRIGLLTPQAGLNAGVAASGVDRMRVSGNDIVGVAPPGEYLGVGGGIVIRAPYAEAAVSLNHVDRDETPPTSPTAGKAAWYAVLADQLFLNRAISRIGAYTAVRLDDSRSLVFGAKRPFIVTAATTVAPDTGAALVAGSSASVLGNSLHGRGGTPAVELFTLSGDCLFNDNRCELRGIGGVAVRITSAATIVSANRVHGGDASMQLVGSVERMTVVGNITTGSILVSSAQLPAPWNALNVRG